MKKNSDALINCLLLIGKEFLILCEKKKKEQRKYWCKKKTTRGIAYTMQITLVQKPLQL